MRKIPCEGLVTLASGQCVRWSQRFRQAHFIHNLLLMNKRFEQFRPKKNHKIFYAMPWEYRGVNQKGNRRETTEAWEKGLNLLDREN